MSVPTVAIGGTALAPQQALLLRVVTVDAAVNLPAVATVELADPAGSVLAATGATVGVTLSVAYGGTTLFTGDVTGLESRYDGTGQVAVVVAYDAAHRLQRHRATTAYPNQTYADVVSAVAGAAGVPVATVDVPAAALPYRARVAEDGWSFLLRLAAEVDRDVVVRAGGLCVVPRAPASSAPVAALAADDPLALHVADDRVLRLRVAVSGTDQVTSTTVRGWDPTTKREVVGTAPAPGTAPGAQPGGAAPARTAGALGTAELTIPAPDVATSDLATALARGAASRAGARIAEVDAEVVGTPSLQPGVAFSVGGTGAALDGRYTATAVRHVFDWELGYRTHVRVGDRAVAVNPPFADAGRGVVPAVVVDNDDVEARLGRVRVRFDWLDTTYVSDWLRVVQPGASAGAGWQVLPEVGDEVLVAFSDDTRTPYVLGGLFNGVDAPGVGWSDVAADGRVVRRVFTSRTGHRLTFVDEDGERGTVTIATGDASATVELTQGRAGVTVTSTHDVAVAADGDVTVSAKQAVSVIASGELTVRGASVSVRSDGELKLEGAKVTVAGSAGVKVTGATIELN